MKMNNHLNSINIAIQELQKFQDQTKHPNPTPKQYIGTIVDNTLGILCSTANSLDGGCRRITFSETRNWVSLMQAVHRSFYSSIHSALELGIIEECKSRDLNVPSSIRKKYLNILNKFEEDKDITKVKKYFEGMKPSFKDYLNSILTISDLDNLKKQQWRDFLECLTIIRNKTSHSTPELTTSEADRLRNNGYGVMLSDENTLQTNPQHYHQVVKHILEFWDDVFYKK
jgi:hypothetical protein